MKPWYQSKTIAFNLLILVLAVWFNYSDFYVNPLWLLLASALGNVLLRTRTSTIVTWGRYYPIVIALLFLASPASAATRCVTPSTACGSPDPSVQAAINVAGQGDIILLKAGTTYTESLHLPNKGLLSAYITITSDAAGGSLPAANVRTGPSFAAFLPKLQSPGGGASGIYFDAGANHYKFQHVSLLWVPAGFGEIVSFGAGDFSQIYEAQEPTDAIFDQVYVLGDAVAGQKRAFGVNGKRFTLTNSYVARIHSVGQDSQCVQGTNGHGPIDIENNYLECATENFILGGGDPAIRTWMHVTGTPTTTSADVTAYETGHTLAELHVGQFLALQTVAGTPTYNSLQFATIATITGTGTTGTITWTPATTVAPIVGGDIRAQVVTDGITFRRNYVTKDPNWFLGVMLAPASPTAVSGGAGGTMAAGQYCYQVQAFSLNGYQNNTVNSALSTEQCITIAVNTKVTVAFSAVTGATSYRIWRGPSPGTENQWTSVTAISNSDDGSLIYTTGTPFGATVVDTKNLFELKCATNVQVDSNIFIHHKKGSDVGYALWLKTVNQDGNGWACQTKNVVIEKNLWSDMNGWLEVHGQEASGNPFPGPLTNLTLQNNLVYGSNQLNGGDIYAMNISQAAVNVTVNHNTIIHTTSGSSGGLLALDSTAAPLSGLIIQSNMLRSETYGIHDPFGSGAAALAAAAPGYIFRNNGVAGGAAPPYPNSGGNINNVYSSNATWEAAFTTYTADGSGGADYHILASGAGTNYHNTGLDGKDMGADITLVLSAITGVAAGTGTNLVITTATLPTGVRTIAYSCAIVASGGTSPYTYAVTSGSLPAGVSLSSGGVCSGTPTATASYTFTVTATDAATATTTQTYTVNILDPVTFTTTSPLPNAIINVAYLKQIIFTGGQSPYVCTIASGALPSGMSLGANTCTITGKASATGMASFSILITGSLGSSATRAFTLTVTPEVLPTGRTGCALFSNIPLCGAFFRQPTTPTVAATGDLWVNTSVTPPSINVAQDSSPTFVNVVASSTDGSALQNLNATELRQGTIPNAALPPNMNVSSSVTTPTFNGATYNVAGLIDFTETNCTVLSTSGHSRLCNDVTTHQVLLSLNGGAYAPLGSGSGSSSSSNVMSNLSGTVGFSLVDDANDPYSMGSNTSNSRNAKLYSYQGSLWQAFTFHDAQVSTDYVFAFCTSSNTGSTWLCPMKVRQDGFLNVSYLTLQTIASYTCDAAHRGQFNYIAGGAGVKDIVQVCGKDAADAYAWRSIY